MPKMGVDPTTTSAPKPLPAGWYEARLKSFVCKMSKSGKGYNYEGVGVVVNNTAEFNDKPVFVRVNNGFNQGRVATDFTHALGIPMEKDGNFPGDWTLKDPTKADDFDGAQYNGPLLGKVMRVELTVDQYEGEDRNQVKQFQCKIDGCAQKYPDIRHLTDIRGKKAA